ncbi:MAG TPA: hypothetical protein VL614_17570 [Acetobacteraceae bacterium]|jgi:hypothetical protein|nr:hypothetical protein [Acetobacteraceae bacterium]
MVEFTYRIIAAPPGHFRVEVTEQGKVPRQTNDFPSAGAAYSWIDRHKEQAAAPRRWWRRLSPRLGRR